MCTKLHWHCPLVLSTTLSSRDSLDIISSLRIQNARITGQRCCCLRVDSGWQQQHLPSVVFSKFGVTQLCHCITTDCFQCAAIWSQSDCRVRERILPTQNTTQLHHGDIMVMVSTGITSWSFTSWGSLHHLPHPSDTTVPDHSVIFQPCVQIPHGKICS